MKILFIVGLTAIMFSCSKPEQTNAPVNQLSQQELVKRGKYLTTIGACNDCHSPKAKDGHGLALDSSKLLSGHPQDEPIPAIPQQQDWVLFGSGLTAFVGPWGISYAANLTPHETGTGNWTFDQFKTAIRHGKYKGMEGSRNLLPPMPWEMYRHMTDDDLLAVFTYLRSIKPVDNLVPAPVPPSDVVFASNRK
jgi:hypothetical protein